MSIFILLTQYFSIALGAIGAGIIVAGGISAFVRFLIGIFEKHSPQENVPKRHIDPVRVQFGRYINFGLEFLVAKDVVETIFLHSWEDLGQLLLLVIIRTIVSYFLGFEVDKIEARKKSRKKT